MFTWVPIYSELAIKLLGYRERQADLINFLKDLSRKGVPVIKLTDKGSDGQETDLSEIDPFTFFSSFNRNIKNEHRIAHLAAAKQLFGLTEPIPSDFAAVPTANNMKAWFFPFAKDRKKDDIGALWDLAGQVCAGSPDTVDAATFDRCLDIEQVALPKLTMGMYWLRPEHFISLDQFMRDFLEKRGISTKATNLLDYRRVIQEVKRKLGVEFPSNVELANAVFAEATRPSPDVPRPESYKMVSRFAEALNATGLRISADLQRRFMASLIAKPFVIVTGSSGTGKTQLAKAVGQWLANDATGTDPFARGNTIVSDRISYFVANSDTLAVEFWNNQKEEEATKVTLPREMIQEWANHIRKHGISAETPARSIREKVTPESRFSAQLHSFETHLKAAAFAVVDHDQAGIGKGSYTIVPVGADWTDNRNVLGFVNYLRRGVDNAPYYQSTPILELVLRATADAKHPYFLILDEMNLSHVERYFADFLSAMESGKPIPLHSEVVDLKTAGGSAVPSSLKLPDNLFIIGTVNVDETTYMFSPKVLDRSNVIEFRISAADVRGFLDKDSAPVREISRAPRDVAEQFLALSRRARGLTAPPLEFGNTDTGGARDYSRRIDDLFGILQRAHSEFGFRTITEVIQYIRVDRILHDGMLEWNWKSSFDEQILQKVLPKLHGARKRLEPLLIDLARYCEVGTLHENGVVYSSDFMAVPSVRRVPVPITNDVTDAVAFRQSYEKLCDMIDIVRRDQFVSFIH